MTTLIEKIIQEEFDGREIYDPSFTTKCIVDSIVDRVLAEVEKVLISESNFMTARGDHGKRFAEEIKWKLKTNFPHLENKDD